MSSEAWLSWFRGTAFLGESMYQEEKRGGCCFQENATLWYGLGLSQLSFNAECGFLEEIKILSHGPDGGEWRGWNIASSQSVPMGKTEIGFEFIHKGFPEKHAFTLINHNPDYGFVEWLLSMISAKQTCELNVTLLSACKRNIIWKLDFHEFDCVQVASKNK